ncbi:MAG: hypothetical protein MUF00_13815, partial [Gemmatimonadaceae bacterium]|nr:hypothetical protein [Gemmatimonadaceae bacterium]
PPPERSIAVLPFADLAPGRDQSWFSDGLTEEIIGVLGRIDGLRVAARSSSFALRDAQLDARRLGDTLRVASLLEGSVRRDGELIRVTARLVDASTGYHRWSATFDRRLRDIMPLQREIAAAIGAALALPLGTAASGGAVTQNADAYDLYLRGVHARAKLTGEELMHAVDYFDRAIQLDSSFAAAWAGKAATIGPLIWYGHLPRAQGAPLMRAAAQRALALDPLLADAHVASGMTALYVDWSWTTAELALRRATVLNANHALAHHFLANVLRAQGRFREAMAARERALALDPLSVRIGMMLGADCVLAGEIDCALTQFRRANELEPRNPAVLGRGPSTLMGLGGLLEARGDDSAAIVEYLRRDSLSGATPSDLSQARADFARGGLRAYWHGVAQRTEARGVPVTEPVHVAWMWSRAGNPARAIEWLERAYRDRDFGLVFLNVVPEFAGLRRDPRVRRMVREMGFE